MHTELQAHVAWKRHQERKLIRHSIFNVSEKAHFVSMKTMVLSH